MTPAAQYFYLSEMYPYHHESWLYTSSIRTFVLLYGGEYMELTPKGIQYKEWVQILEEDTHLLKYDLFTDLKPYQIRRLTNEEHNYYLNEWNKQ